MSEAVQGYRIKRVLGVQKHPDLPGEIAIVLEDEDRKKLALLLDSQSCEDVSGTILAASSELSPEGLGFDLAADLRAVEKIDQVEVSAAPSKADSPTPFDLQFQVAGHPRLTLHISHSQAVRMMHGLRSKLAERIKRQN